MKTFKTASVGLLVLAAMSLGTLPAQEVLARDGTTPVDISPDVAHTLAARILARCGHRIKRLATACERSNLSIARRCAHAIRFLLDNGNERLARRVYNFCKRLIRSRTERCIQAIRHLCKRCHNALVAAHATDAQLHALRNLCAQAIEVVRHSAERACAILDAAVDGHPDTGTTP